MADPKNNDISTEFQDAGMEGLSLNLIAILDLHRNIVFAKAYDQQLPA